MNTDPTALVDESARVSRPIFALSMQISDASAKGRLHETKRSWGVARGSSGGRRHGRASGAFGGRVAEVRVTAITCGGERDLAQLVQILLLKMLILRL